MSYIENWTSFKEYLLQVEVEVHDKLTYEL